MREMNLDLVKTQVDGVYIGFCTKAWAPEESAYLFPMEKGLNDTEDGGVLAKEWKYVFSFLPRRDTDIDDGITPMKTKKGSKWDWKAVLLLIDEAASSHSGDSELSVTATIRIPVSLAIFATLIDCDA